MAGVQGFLAFAEAGKRGSFAAAARELGLSPSAIAKGVARLEDELGVRLFHRTTRQVSLTGEGRELYERCRRIVDEIEALRDEASGVRAEPSGTLRVNAPIVLGRIAVVPALAVLVRRHPGIALEVGLSDRYVDVIGEGLDAVVRVGPLRDSALVARRIGEQRHLVVAAPSYLERHGAPKTPADLASHRCLVFRNPSTGRPRPWQLQDGRRAVELVPASTVTMNDGEALVAAVAEGMGLVQVPEYIAGETLRRGRVIEVLARFRPPPLPISVVYPSARRVTPRVRALIEVLSEEFGRRVVLAAVTGRRRRSARAA
jgi:DNA-binding transcriptional LysR family regulator